MRRVAVSAACTFLRHARHQREAKGPVDAPLDEAQLRDMEEEAQQRGFMRRDSSDAKVYMEMNFSRPEMISGGVPVSNLPPVEREKTEFDVYQRSTRDFTSQVTPYGVTGVGLGAGFGAREDKRLGFLRPRKLQPFGGESSIVPKYDENGMPIDATLTKEQLMKKRLVYMKSFEGTTMSHREHFLLVDLDFEKDAMIFGNTRGEFEKNVMRLKNVISTYTKWERTDNFYYYGTIVLKALTVWVLMECLQQYYELKLLAAHYDDYVEAMEETLSSLETNLQRDLQRARDELQAHRPDFKHVVDAIRREKHRLEAEAARAARRDEQTADDGNVSACGDDTVSAQLGEVIGAGNLKNLSLSPEPNQTAVESLTLNNSSNNFQHHPMDTTYEQAYLSSLRKRETEYEMRRLQETASSSRASYNVFGTLWRKIRGKNSDGALVTPLQQEDFARFSYAASPTSIDTLRAIRRVLLPRSEDYIQVVREEMLEYKRQKESELVHPE